MTDFSLNGEFERFRKVAATFRDEAAEGELRSSAALGVGLLIGGGFPGAAAALAVLAERAFPASDYPWRVEEP